MSMTNKQLEQQIRRARHFAIKGNRAQRARAKIRLYRLRRKFRARYHQFDNAKVTYEWLWLLTKARQNGWKGSLTGPATGLRTYQQQARLYNLFIRGQGAPAFPPNGPSRHMIFNVKVRGRWAQAVDATDAEGLIAAARKVGVTLHRPYLPREPWHVEAVRKFKAPNTFLP